MRMILKIVLIYLKGYLQIQEFITLRIPGPALTCASLQDVKWSNNILSVLLSVAAKSSNIFVSKFSRGEAAAARSAPLGAALAFYLHFGKF